MGKSKGGWGRPFFPTTDHSPSAEGASDKSWLLAAPLGTEFFPEPFPSRPELPAPGRRVFPSFCLGSRVCPFSQALPAATTKLWSRLSKPCGFFSARVTSLLRAWSKPTSVPNFGVPLSVLEDTPEPKPFPFFDSPLKVWGLNCWSNFWSPTSNSDSIEFCLDLPPLVPLAPPRQAPKWNHETSGKPKSDLRWLEDKFLHWRDPECSVEWKIRETLSTTRHLSCNLCFQPFLVPLTLLPLTNLADQIGFWGSGFRGKNQSKKYPNELKDPKRPLGGSVKSTIHIPRNQLSEETAKPSISKQPLCSSAAEQLTPTNSTPGMFWAPLPAPSSTTPLQGVAPETGGTRLGEPGLNADQEATPTTDERTGETNESQSQTVSQHFKFFQVFLATSGFFWPFRVKPWPFEILTTELPSNFLCVKVASSVFLKVPSFFSFWHWPSTSISWTFMFSFIGSSFFFCILRQDPSGGTSEQVDSRAPKDPGTRRSAQVKRPPPRVMVHIRERNKWIVFFVDFSRISGKSLCQQSIYLGAPPYIMIYWPDSRDCTHNREHQEHQTHLQKVKRNWKWLNGPKRLVKGFVGHFWEKKCEKSAAPFFWRKTLLGWGKKKTLSPHIGDKPITTQLTNHAWKARGSVREKFA